MKYHQRLGLLILNMTTVSAVVAGVSIFLVYRTAFEQEKQRLVETVQSQARIIEVIARNTKNPQTTLNTFADAQKNLHQLGETGEFILAKRENSKIIFLWHHQNDVNKPKPIPGNTQLAEPMQAALRGESGIITGLDDRGVKVLAAYEAISGLNWGLVAKINLTEIRAPFIQASIQTLIIALIINCLGAFLFLEMIMPLIEKIKESEKFKQLNQQLEEGFNEKTTQLQNTNEKLLQENRERQRLEEALRHEIDLLARIMETSPVGIILVNPEGKIILASQQAEQVLGQQDITQRTYNIFEWKITDYDGNSLPEEELPLQQVLHNRQPVYEEHHAIELPNGEKKLLSVNASPLLNPEDKIDAVVLTIEDITERVKVEAALIHSEAQFRAIFEQAAVGIAIVTINGEFIRFNQRYCDLLGYSESELQQKTYQEITYPEDWEKNKVLVSQMLVRKITNVSLEKRYICKNGKLQWVNLTISTIFDSEDKLQYLIKIVEDIAERKQSEEALRESEERFRSIFNQVSAGIVQISLSGRFILFNDKFLDIVQYSAEELQQKTFQEITHPDDISRNVSYIQQIFKGEIEDFSLEKRYIRPDGSIVWVHLGSSVVRNEQGEPMYLISVVEDISTRKKALEDLRESEERYRRIIETTAEGVWIIDAENKTTFVNQRMARMLGYTVAEILGKSIFDFIDIDSRELAAINLDSHRQGITECHDFKFRRKDQTELWAIITNNPIFDNSGAYIGALGMLTDITDRKLTEKAVQLINEQLTVRIKELEQRHQDILLLNQINDFLQACLSVEEAYQVIGELLKPLFPQCSGGLFMLNESNTFVEMVANWGTDINSKTLFTLDECWALRRGSIHWVQNHYHHLFCQHSYNKSNLEETLCIPMMAQGQAVGLFYLSTTESGTINEVKKELARAVSKHISLALANLKLRATLETQSIEDPLTGLYNRRYMQESLKREISLAQRKQYSVGIIMLDVDHFKQFNDTFGHKAGDLILKELGDFINHNIRSEDIACRYGGEELLLILPEASLEDSQQRAEQIRRGIKQLDFKHYEQSFSSITVSLGVAVFPEHGKTGEVVIHAADMALCQAKQNGRDRVVVFSSVV